MWLMLVIVEKECMGDAERRKAFLKIDCVIETINQ